MNYSTILLKRNLVSIPEQQVSQNTLSDLELVTVVNNFAYYGYILSLDTLHKLSSIDKNLAINFINETLQSLKEITYSDRNMADFVVYKNFPQEVIQMSHEIYWIKQILMYVGFDSSFFTEEVKERPSFDDEIKQYKVISLANENTHLTLLNNLISTKSLWSQDQFDTANFLINEFKLPIKLNDFSFKLNGLKLISLNLDKEFYINNATDVLRLAAFCADLNPMSKTLTFKSFSRSQRKLYLSLLDQTNNLVEDIFMNKSTWKQFLKLLHPNDYKFKNVIQAQHILYNNEYKSFNSLLESYLKNHDQTIFSLLQQRAGLFSNILFSLYSKFGFTAFEQFSNVIQNVDTKKLLKLKLFLLKNNSKTKTIYKAPSKKFVHVNYNLTDMQEQVSSKEQLLDKINLLVNSESPLQKEIVEIIKSDIKSVNEITKDRVIISEEHLNFIVPKINTILKERMLEKFGHTLFVDPKTSMIKLKDNDSSLNNFGKGTTFDIPKNIKFIRTASFWTKKESYAYWIDNSVNFFDANFKHLDATCWNSIDNEYSVFSGDPVISFEEPSACQMIDINIKKAMTRKVRYVVLSALSFNNVPFTDFDDSVLNIQFSEKQESGELFEPFRSAISFKLNSDAVKNKVVAIFDLLNRKVIFVDQFIPSLNVSSAMYNGEILEHYLNYNLENVINSPSIYDLLESIHDENSESKILYSDKDYLLNKNYKHFSLFKENKENDVEFYDLESFL